MNKPKNENSGCLWMFLFGIFLLFGFIFILMFGFGTNLSLLLSAVVATFLTIKILGKPEIKDILVNLVVITSLLGCVRFVKNILSEYNPLAEPHFEKSEAVEYTTLVENNDTIPVFVSHRDWKDNYGNNFKGNLTIRETDFTRLQFLTNSFVYDPSSRNFWGELYKYIDKTDTPSLDLVMATFQQIHAERKLNQMEFAEMVVSCIQDIPYSFVFQEACLPAENYEPSIRHTLESCPECCIGGVPYGIQNPVSFLQNLKGDCDTRTVIIYSILKHFNYDVAILNSTFYRHSILGINLPGNGTAKIYNGKRYLVWETTARYFEAGTLSSSFNDINHWDVVLTSK